MNIILWDPINCVNGEIVSESDPRSESQLDMEAQADVLAGVSDNQLLSHRLEGRTEHFTCTSKQCAILSLGWWGRGDPESPVS